MYLYVIIRHSLVNIIRFMLLWTFVSSCVCNVDAVCATPNTPLTKDYFNTSRPTTKKPRVQKWHFLLLTSNILAQSRSCRRSASDTVSCCLNWPTPPVVFLDCQSWLWTVPATRPSATWQRSVLPTCSHLGLPKPCGKNMWLPSLFPIQFTNTFKGMLK